MIALILACIVFLGLHLGVAGTGLRAVVVGRIGENPYRGLFALIALGALVWICMAYGPAYRGGENRFFFDPPQIVRDFALPVVGIALLLALPGFLMTNPTSAGQEGAKLYGMQRITRHPFLWGTILWSGYHLVGAGDLASTILFSTFLALAAAGTRLIDARARRRLGEAGWASLAGQSSNLPFAAILAGRTRFCARETFDWRFAVGVGYVLIMLYFHAALFGLSPFPGGVILPF